MRSLLNTRVVLISPLYGGNVGSVCRAMMNMGLSDLAIVAPRRKFAANDAKKMACHAKSIWIARKEHETLAEAVADCVAVAGTTARGGLYRAHVKSPRAWAPTLLELATQGPVALVFGPEDNGLSNEDLAACTHLIRIPSSPTYESLNLAQAVLICAYELYAASGDFKPRNEDSTEAPAHLRERMYSMWRDVLIEIGFMEEAKADHMMLAVNRILSRDNLSETDVRIMMGIARQMNWFAQSHGDTSPQTDQESPSDDPC